MSVNREAAQQLDIELLSDDVDLIRKVQKSREDRNSGRVKIELSLG